MSDRVEQCERCKWWTIEPEIDPTACGGICHRMPPVFVGTGSNWNELYWEFPPTRHNEFCGEFTPKGEGR